jgi:very-short-patch-repair endonuclease
MSDTGSELVLRRLARAQWVRLHGTPRITVLIGDAHARDLWTHWTALSGTAGTLLEGELDAIVRDAARLAVATPEHPIAVLARREDVAAWRTGRSDRLAAMVDEGIVHVDATSIVAPPAASDPSSRSLFNARSAAEAMLFEALEATAATAGRFELNGRLSVRFGPTAAEVDLISRADRIAIEIDGFHHFADPECYRRDRRKDVLLQTQGLLVIRLLAEDVMRDVRSSVNVVHQALAYRAAGSKP